MRQTWKDYKRKQSHHAAFPLLQFLGKQAKPTPLNVGFKAGVDLRWTFCYPITMGAWYRNEKCLKIKGYFSHTRVWE